MGTGSFPGVKSGRGVMLILQPILVPWSRKCRAIPLLPLWAVWPVQSLSACTRVQLYLYSPCGPYGLYRASVLVQGVYFIFTSNVMTKWRTTRYIRIGKLCFLPCCLSIPIYDMRVKPSTICPYMENKTVL